MSHHDGFSDIETAVEADEQLVFESLDDHKDDEGDEEKRRCQKDVDAEVINGDVIGSGNAGDSVHQEFMKTYWVWAGLPVCFLLFLQLLPLPSWIIGKIVVTTSPVN